MTENIKHGIVKNISVQMSSGLAVVYFEDGAQVFIDSGMGARNLSRAIEEHGSREIFYLTDEFGLMELFGFSDDE